MPKKVPEKTAPNAKNTLEKTAYYVNRLFYHTWKKENSIHAYEIDFLVASRAKIVPIEIKSSDVNTHKSITEFSKKYSGKVLKQFLFSQKDVRHMEQLMFKPIYMLPFAMEDLLE